ncbi:MerR family transcriptional regulator, partial [Nocardia donostiensis]
MPRQQTLRIGQLAKLAGTSTRSIRYYESIGLLQSERADNGYRVYTDETVTVIRNIRKLLDAGLNCKDIGTLGSCLAGADFDDQDVCRETIALFEQRLASIESALTSLSASRERIIDDL